MVTWKEKTNEVVKSFFKENLPLFSLTNEGVLAPYWHIEFVRDNVKIEISGDIGFIIYIYRENTKYALWQYDRSVNEKTTTSKENILYQLNVLKRFLKEIGF